MQAFQDAVFGTWRPELSREIFDKVVRYLIEHRVSRSDRLAGKLPAAAKEMLR